METHPKISDQLQQVQSSTQEDDVRMVPGSSAWLQHHQPDHMLEWWHSSAVRSVISMNFILCRRYMKYIGCLDSRKKKACQSKETIFRYYGIWIPANFSLVKYQKGDKYFKPILSRYLILLCLFLNVASDFMHLKNGIHYIIMN